MITDFSFSNFKSWQKVDSLKFGKVTGLFGANSSGKTSIINLLLLLKQTIESPDRKQILSFGADRDYIQLRSFEDIIFNHDTASPLSLSIGLKSADELKIYDTEKPGKENVLYKDDTIIFSGVIVQKNKLLCVDSLNYEFDGIEVSMRHGDNNEYSLTGSSKKNRNLLLKREKGIVLPLPEPVKFYGFPDQVRTYYQNSGFLYDLQLMLETSFSKIFYLGPLRDYPQPQYTWTGTQPNDMGRRGERFVEAILTSRERGDLISRGKNLKRLSVEEYIALWLKQLNLIDSFAVKEIKEGTNIYQVLVKRNQNSTPVLITDVGFGVSQILPVITLCYYAKEGSTLIIEQPEIHLHPMVQAGLADIFVDVAKKRNIQIIIESHSEHLLRRLQRKIAEEEITSDDVKLYFCEMANGHSELTPINMDMFGIIQNWPKDFFGNEFEDIALMNSAIMKRKKNAK